MRVREGQVWVNYNQPHPRAGNKTQVRVIFTKDSDTRKGETSDTCWPSRD